MLESLVGRSSATLPYAGRTHKRAPSQNSAGQRMRTHMPEQTIPGARRPKLPGLDSKVTPMLGVGLGLTGLLLGVRPRLAAWPLALTAVAALLYRDPDRVTPDTPDAIFAPADGVVIGVDDLYEHRFLHTDAVRVAIAASPFDVPFHRSPAAGRVGYLEHVSGEYGPIWDR